MLLSDVLVFLQEKDQRFVFASLVSDVTSLLLSSDHVSAQCDRVFQDQRSTVIALRNLIVREVANKERGTSSSILSLYWIPFFTVTCVLQSQTAVWG